LSNRKRLPVSTLKTGQSVVSLFLVIEGDSTVWCRLDSAKAQQAKADLDEGWQVKLFASKAASAQDRHAAVQNNAAMKATVDAAKAPVEQANSISSSRKSPGLARIAKRGIGDPVRTW
jgi:hypothetical protein